MRDIDNYTISKEETEERVDRWMHGGFTIVPYSEESSKRHKSPTADTETIELNSFLFDFEDFKQFVARVALLTPGTVTGVACRIGIKGDNTACLIFEALEGFSPDPLAPGRRRGDLPNLPDGNKETTARYDFSYPCPPTCPPTNS
jgi:hypothetical protein